MMNYTLLSSEHLLNIRKIIDNMAMQAAQLSGGAEALRLLYPAFMNSQNHMDIYNTAKFMNAGSNYPLPIYLTEISKEIGIELENRKIGLSHEPKQ